MIISKKINILKLLSIIVKFFSPFLLIFLCKTLSNCLFNTYCINYNCSCKIREIILLLYKNLNCWTKTIILMTNSLSHYIVCCILLINCWNKKLTNSPSPRMFFCYWCSYPRYAFLLIDVGIEKFW